MKNNIVMNMLMLSGLIAISSVSMIQGCSSTGGALAPAGLTASQSVIVECDTAVQAIDAAIANLPKMTNTQVNVFNSAVQTITPVCESTTIPTPSAQKQDLLTGAVLTITNLNNSLKAK